MTRASRRSLRRAALAATILLSLSACGTMPGGAGDVVGDILTLVAQPTRMPPMPGGIRTPQPPVVSGEGEVWAVYFTDPAIPFDGVTTGGVEENLIWLIDHAASTIDVAMFEFDLENMADALIDAHEDGVRVRIVYDDEHTADDGVVARLLGAGIPGTPDQRGAYMHNKFAVFDGQVVWTGSTNFTENGVYRNNNNALALVSPEVARNYTAEFEEMFAGAFGPGSPADTPYPGAPVGDLWVETYFGPEDDPMAQLIDLVSEAQQSIHFMAFSFTKDELGDAILARAAEGVEVVGLFETRGANTTFSECQRFLDSGLDVRLDGNPRVMHHKVVIIDGRVVATGSFNFSENATSDNDENLVFIHSPQVAAQYEAEFIRLVGMGVPPQGGQCLAGE